jgi:hypothetical protein
MYAMKNISTHKLTSILKSYQYRMVETLIDLLPDFPPTKDYAEGKINVNAYLKSIEDEIIKPILNFAKGDCTGYYGCKPFWNN